MLLVESSQSSIYEPRVGYPVYYQNAIGNGYVPPSPPYPYQAASAAQPGFTVVAKSEWGFHGVAEKANPTFVYPQLFPTPPLSVCPDSPRYHASPSPPCSLLLQQRPPRDSFQISRLLNLDDHDHEHEQHNFADEEEERRHRHLLAMRTASVIMKIEDQRVFHVDSTTAVGARLLDDEDSACFEARADFRLQHHQQQSQQCQVQQFDAGSAVVASTDTESLFICKWEKCYKVFRHLNELAGHVTQAHGTAPAGSVNYYCKWEGCPRTDRGFNARYKMLVHIRTHTKEKPHQCPECFKSFSRAENLKIHIRSHSGEKPYVCPVEGCNKAYSNSSDRFKHTRTHSMTKPYQCKVPGCNKRYTDPSSLRKHVKTYKHKQGLLDEEASMQERGISSTSDETDEPAAIEMSPLPSTASCSSLDQGMTDLDIHERERERSLCYCSQEQVKSSSSSPPPQALPLRRDVLYEEAAAAADGERVKMYHLGCEVLVSSSGRGGSFAEDLDAPLDLSLRQKQQ